VNGETSGTTPYDDDDGEDVDAHITVASTADRETARRRRQAGGVADEGFSADGRRNDEDSGTDRYGRQLRAGDDGADAGPPPRTAAEAAREFQEMLQRHEGRSIDANAVVDLIREAFESGNPAEIERVVDMVKSSVAARVETMEEDSRKDKILIDALQRELRMLREQAGLPPDGLLNDEVRERTTNSIDGLRGTRADMDETLRMTGNANSIQLALARDPVALAALLDRCVHDLTGLDSAITSTRGSLGQLKEGLTILFGDEANLSKAATQEILDRFQQLRTAAVDAEVRKRLEDAISKLPPEDQDRLRAEVAKSLPPPPVVTDFDVDESRTGVRKKQFRTASGELVDEFGFADEDYETVVDATTGNMIRRVKSGRKPRPVPVLLPGEIDEHGYAADDYEVVVDDKGRPVRRVKSGRKPVKVDEFGFADEDYETVVDAETGQTVRRVKSGRKPRVVKRSGGEEIDEHGYAADDYEVVVDDKGRPVRRVKSGRKPVKVDEFGFADEDYETVVDAETGQTVRRVKSGRKPRVVKRSGGEEIDEHGYAADDYEVAVDESGQPVRRVKSGRRPKIRTADGSVIEVPPGYAVDGQGGLVLVDEAAAIAAGISTGAGSRPPPGFVRRVDGSLVPVPKGYVVNADGILVPTSAAAVVALESVPAGFVRAADGSLLAIPPGYGLAEDGHTLIVVDPVTAAASLSSRGAPAGFVFGEGGNLIPMGVKDNALSGKMEGDQHRAHGAPSWMPVVAADGTVLFVPSEDSGRTGYVNSDGSLMTTEQLMAHGRMEASVLNQAVSRLRDACKSGDAHTVLQQAALMASMLAGGPMAAALSLDPEAWNAMPLEQRRAHHQAILAMVTSLDSLGDIDKSQVYSARTKTLVRRLRILLQEYARLSASMDLGGGVGMEGGLGNADGKLYEFLQGMAVDQETAAANHLRAEKLLGAIPGDLHVVGPPMGGGASAAGGADALGEGTGVTTSLADFLSRAEDSRVRSTMQWLERRRSAAYQRSSLPPPMGPVVVTAAPLPMSPPMERDTTAAEKFPLRVRASGLNVGDSSDFGMGGGSMPSGSGYVSRAASRPTTTGGSAAAHGKWAASSESVLSSAGGDIANVSGFRSPGSSSLQRAASTLGPMTGSLGVSRSRSGLTSPSGAPYRSARPQSSMSGTGTRRERTMSLSGDETAGGRGPSGGM
jgi:hypothetical protein